jgi:hypothetical protein
LSARLETQGDRRAGRCCSTTDILH